MKILNEIVNIFSSFFEKSKQPKLKEYIKFEIKPYDQQMKEFNKELIESMPWYRKKKE